MAIEKESVGSGNNGPVASDRCSQSQVRASNCPSGSETVTTFETAIGFEVANSPTAVSNQSDISLPLPLPLPLADANGDKKLVKKKKSCSGTNTRSVATGSSSTKRKAARSQFVIQTDDSGTELDEGTEGQVWESTYRGMPSWLSSLIIHLSIILFLALLTVDNGGRTVIDLLAAATESVELDPQATFEIKLNPEEIESVSQEIEAIESQLLDTSELEPVLDDAMLIAGLESEMNDAIFSDGSTDGNLAGDRETKVGGGAKFFGVEGNGSEFVFVVDCSGSMGDYGRWNRAVRELKQSIRKLDSRQKFLILLYNDGYIAMNKDTELVKSTEREQKRAFRWLGRKRPDSWTFCAEALAKALTLRPDAIFLLSDGEFDDRADVFFVLDSLNGSGELPSEQRRQIPVHTIALGSHEGRFTMKRIADENSGSFEMIE